MSWLARCSQFVRLAWQTVFIALPALRRNRMRSALTALGIIIGVASVIAMVGAGKGAQQSVQQRVSSLGENMLTVFAGSRRSGGVNTGLGSASTLTVADAEAIRREVPDVVAVSPEVSTPAQAIANGRNWSTSAVGVQPEYLLIRDWKVERGAMFESRDVRAASKVAVIGSKTATELFGPLDPIGQTVRVHNIPFVIIGVLESKGSGMGGGNQDDRLLIPYTTAMKRVTGDRYIKSILLQVSAADRSEAVQQQVTALLRQRHRLTAGRDDDFNIFSQKDIADTVTSITGIITLLLGAISSISLLVGGIGIMNIMLVSVTERTREIGLRMAVGARPMAITMQFMLEAITLSVLGGLAGVVLGFVAAQVVEAVADFAVIIEPSTVALACAVSAAIGVFFGFYPATKAAALDPIDTLRYE
jgi:putative ABC transport system permease protein